jgi:formylglycine-generating enzyme required for sulfatase activity
MRAGLFLALAGLFQWPVHAADTTPPTGTIVINNNRSSTNSVNITLSLTWDDGSDGSGVSRMRFSDDGAHWSAWEVPRATHAYTLPPGPDGHRTVRVQYLDKANNRSLAYSDYILLDTTAPTGCITINGDTASTTSQTVVLGLDWADTGVGVSRVRFSDDGAHWSTWEPPTATRVYTLPAGLGNHTVRTQFLDGAGNYSVACKDYVKLVASPTVGTIDTMLLPGNVPLMMVWIPGGTFLMGCYPNEQDSWGGGEYESPQHTVTVGGFWMARYELTKREWTAVMGTAPWTGQSQVLADLDSPAVFVSWDDAHSFLTALSSYTGQGLRLPSESEWEYACRAGTTTRFYWGDDPLYTAIGLYAWYELTYTSEAYAQVVGQKRPNAFGLYDMSGNVEECCEDDWHDYYRKGGAYESPPTDGRAWVNTPRYSYRTCRGGDYYNYAAACRSAFRFPLGIAPNDASWNIGFRVARTL